MPDPIATTRAAADTAVTTAVSEAREAANLAQALEERVRDGDDTVTPDQIASARELGHFAQLRADATARKAETAKRDARLAALAELKADIDAYQADNGDQAAALLDSTYKALNAYVDHVQDHTKHINEWRQRMTDLHVPEHTSPFIPGAEHGHLGHHAGDLIAGDTVYRTLSPWPALNSLVSAAHHRAAGSPRALIAEQEKIDAAKQGIKAIAPRPQVRPGLVHYRGSGGAIITYDPDKAPTPEDVKRNGMKPITEDEAYA